MPQTRVHKTGVRPVTSVVLPHRGAALERQADVSLQQGFAAGRRCVRSNPEPGSLYQKPVLPQPVRGPAEHGMNPEGTVTSHQWEGAARRWPCKEGCPSASGWPGTQRAALSPKQCESRAEPSSLLQEIGELRT